MILDIEGREINVGDECIFSSLGWYGIIRVKIARFTGGRIFYYTYNRDNKDYNTWEFFINKSSKYCKFYKIC